ncbi:hypothetical protein KKE78_03705 [Patescibacteria group bacterium]|nr:hypothetical protein [Patescibacteria group bacterium]
MKKFTIIILIFTFIYIAHLALIQTAVAVESSPSAQTQIKLEELKKEIASKAAKLKQVVNRKLKDKAYIGKIKSISDTSLTLATESSPKIVSINQDTVFENEIKKKTKLSGKTLVEDDYIVALGDTDEVGVLTARKVILLPESPEQQKTFLWGQIISISDQLVTIKNNESKNTALTLPSGSKVKLNNFVILTGFKGKNDIFKTEFVYIVPQGGIIKPKKIATPSSEISSPSAEPTSKKAN